MLLRSKLPRLRRTAVTLHKRALLIFAISRAEENTGKIGLTFFKIPTVSVGVDHVVSGGGVVVVLIDVVARERVVVGLQVSVIEDQDQRSM